ncbi:DUF1045 domain-containing protein [Rhodospirillaceae bacterium SYSU D60014]|uniref:DUF1045 domain-containing protein n=1 Tax=Virgifigura deserti TaxID=2268457 RepID=UPI000E66D21B
MAARYALYYAPEPGSALETFGRRWLGCESATREAAPRLEEITRAPRHYGFHGTLKAPFRLADGHSLEALQRAITAFAATRAGFELPPLRLATLGRFLALVSSGPCEPLASLAADCVTAFDSFRKPPSADELARRRANGLTERQNQLLIRWGYPYVLDEFRFHLTLTGSLDDEREREAVRRTLAPLVTPLCEEPVAVQSICLFEQADGTAPFRIARRYAFGG